MSCKKFLKSLFATAFVVTLFLTAARSQQPASSPVPSAGPLVNLNLMVVDSKNHAVETIKKEDLKVFEDKSEQQGINVELDERPTDIAIAIDASGSFAGLLPYAIEAAKLIINNRRPADEIYIGTFISSDKIETVQDFTSDTSALHVALNRFRTEGGQSAVLDAIYLTADHAASHKVNEDRRKVVVVITDGEDRNSFYKPSDVMKLLQEKSVQMFALAITIKLNEDSGFIRQSPRERAEKLLTTLADETGGRTFFSKTPKELGEWVEETIHSLKSSFRLSYRSSNKSTKKGFRKISVAYFFPKGEERRVIAPTAYFFARPVSLSDKKFH